MTPPHDLLRAENISLTFSNGNGGLHVLDSVSLEVSSDEFVCVVGPSGCGKTSLLRILAGLLEPSSGQVVFSGERLARPQRRIGFVFQQANLMPWRTAINNICLPLELAGLTKEEKQDRARSLIELMGLQGFEEMFPRDLSGGMAQRVAIGRALVHEPDVLLLDEPFGSLDALTRERMGDELLRIWKAHRGTLLMVTHSIPEAVLLADRVIVLSERPARVVLNLEIPIPRPRSIDYTYTEEFGTLAAQVRGAIRATVE